MIITTAWALHPGSPKKSAWFDEASHTPIIAEKARRAESFIAAMADGKIDESEIHAQESRLVDIDAGRSSRSCRPPCTPRSPSLLCELTVYDFMQAMHSIQQARPKSVFRG